MIGFHNWVTFRFSLRCNLDLHLWCKLPKSTEEQHLLTGRSCTFALGRGVGVSEQQGPIGHSCRSLRFHPYQKKKKTKQNKKANQTGLSTPEFVHDPYFRPTTFVCQSQRGFLGNDLWSVLMGTYCFPRFNFHGNPTNLDLLQKLPMWSPNHASCHCSNSGSQGCRLQRIVEIRQKKIKEIDIYKKLLAWI